MPIPLRRFDALGVACCQVLVCGSVLAAPPVSRGEISWHAPPSCGTSADLKQGVIRLLEGDASGLAGKVFSAEVVEERSGNWRLTLKGVTDQGSWTRTLSGAGCSELRNAAEVMIALAIEPSRASMLTQPGSTPAQAQTTGPVRPESAGPTQPGTAPVQPGTAPVRHEAAAPDAPRALALRAASPNGTRLLLRPVAFHVVAPDRQKQAKAKASVASVATSDEPKRTSAHEAGASQMTPNDSLWLLMQGGISTHVLPKPTPLVMLGALLRTRELALAGSVGWMAHQTADGTDPTGAGARVSLVFAAGKIGYVWAHSAWELDAHTGLVAGAMLAKSIGITGGQSNYGPFGALSAGMTVAYPAQSLWSLELSADGLVSFLSPDFRAEEIGRVYQSGLLGGLVAGGLRIRLK